MHKLLFNVLTVLTVINLISCDIGKSDTPEPSSGFEHCANVTPYISLQEKGSDLDLNGFIWAQALNGVDSIVVSSISPLNGKVEGTSLLWMVSTGNIDGTHDDKPVWRLPFSVNETNIDYNISVTYYCKLEDEEPGGGSVGGYESGDVTIIEYGAEFNYYPGNFCDPGGESLSIWEEGTLINDTNLDTITSQVFNIKWQTRPPNYQTEGLLFLFPIEEIESAYIEMKDKYGVNTLTKPFNLNWFTKQWIEDEVYIGDLSYLSANINISDLLSGMEPEELDNYSHITFVIKYCGGKEFSDSIYLKL